MTTIPAAHKPEEAVASQEIVIEAGKTELHYWRDLWSYRELLYFLAWRDILVRYKQTTVGVAWAVIRPTISIVIITVIFQKVAGLPSNGIPSFLFVGAGTLTWQLFANAFSDSGNSLLG